MAEIWRVIPSYPDYEVSSFGRVRRKTRRKSGGPTSKILKTRLSPQGYIHVTLMKPETERCNLPYTKRWTPRIVSRLVCEAFHGLPSFPDAHAAHNNGDPTDNRPENLRWATAQENFNDQIKHGTIICGEKTKRAKLTREAVREIRALRQEGISWLRISQKYGVAVRTVRDVVNEKTWKHS